MNKPIGNLYLGRSSRRTGLTELFRARHHLLTILIIGLAVSGCGRDSPCKTGDIEVEASLCTMGDAPNLIGCYETHVDDRSVWCAKEDQSPECLAVPTCDAGDQQVDDESACLRDAPCYQKKACGKSIWCSGTDVCEDLPQCNPGDNKVSKETCTKGNQSASDDPTCYLVRRCGKKQWCKEKPATCLAVPTCDAGHQQVDDESACLQRGACYQKKACGTTIWCSGADVCALDFSHQRLRDRSTGVPSQLEAGICPPPAIRCNGKPLEKTSLLATLFILRGFCDTVLPRQIIYRVFSDGHITYRVFSSDGSIQEDTTDWPAPRGNLPLALATEIYRADFDAFDPPFVCMPIWDIPRTFTAFFVEGQQAASVEGCSEGEVHVVAAATEVYRYLEARGVDLKDLIIGRKNWWSRPAPTPDQN